MKMLIHSNDTLEILQRTFNSAFPYLKLEFFTRPHDKGRPTEKQYLINTKRTVDSCNPQLTETTVSIPTAMTVQELEEVFQQELGLYIQVFRKSGNVWLETTATDSWTLHKQNEEGQELSRNERDNSDEIPDYHEQP
ncbi:MAG: hypothetical protein ACK5BL_07860 [Flavobacteriales bacterium]|jgi:hypothetical protein